MYGEPYQKKLLTTLGDFSAGRILRHDELGSCFIVICILICILIVILIPMPYYGVAQRTAAIVLKANGYSNAQINEQTSIPPQIVINLP